MKIFDVFPFFNELDILKIRLVELAPIVDEFVLIESELSHMMKKKELFYENNKHLFKDYNIKHIIITEQEFNDAYDGNPWSVERFQRNYAAKYLCKICHNSDIVVLSDADEIPSIEQVTKFYRSEHKACSFTTKLYRYKLNLYFQDWNVSHLFRWSELNNYIDNFSIVRTKKFANKFHTIKVPSGWHFSSIGDKETVWYKLNNFAHALEHKKANRLNKHIVFERMDKGLHPFKNKPLGSQVSISDMPIDVRLNYHHYHRKGLIL